MSIEDILLRLGITANYRGYFYLISAVELCLADRENLHLVTKYVYPKVAKLYHTNWQAVERNIRTVGKLAWTHHRAFLEELARGPLGQRPGNAKLLAILTTALSPSRDRPPRDFAYSPGPGGIKIASMF